MVKRLTAIILIIVVLLVLGSVPVSAAKNGPPNGIINHTDVPGEVTLGILAQGPLDYINIWLPSQSNSALGSMIDIDPMTHPAD